MYVVQAVVRLKAAGALLLCCCDAALRCAVWVPAPAWQLQHVHGLAAPRLAEGWLLEPHGVLESSRLSWASRRLGTAGRLVAAAWCWLRQRRSWACPARLAGLPGRVLRMNAGCFYGRVLDWRCRGPAVADL